MSPATGASVLSESPPPWAPGSAAVAAADAAVITAERLNDALSGKCEKRDGVELVRRRLFTEHPSSSPVLNSSAPSTSEETAASAILSSGCCSPFSSPPRLPQGQSWQLPPPLPRCTADDSCDGDDQPQRYRKTSSPRGHGSVGQQQLLTLGDEEEDLAKTKFDLAAGGSISKGASGSSSSSRSSRPLASEWRAARARARVTLMESSRLESNAPPLPCEDDGESDTVKTAFAPHPSQQVAAVEVPQLAAEAVEVTEVVEVAGCVGINHAAHDHSWADDSSASQCSLHDEGQPTASNPAVGPDLPLDGNCNITVEDISQISEFEQLNEQLRRHGFHTIPHRLEASQPPVASRARLVADVRGLWVACGEVLSAYNERGRRLRDALLAERSEERRVRDGRIRALLQENTRLQAELRSCRGSSASEVGSPPRSSSVGRKMERELSDLALRTKTAEATARQRERELERLRSRLEHLVAEAARRQDREREALARPLRRTSGSGAAREDQQLLEAALAHKARAVAAQAEATSLNKQVRTLSQRLEAAEHRCRRLDTRASGFTVDEAEDQSGQKVEEQLRQQLEEQLRQQAKKRAEERTVLEQSLTGAEERIERLQGELQCASRQQHQPSASELRWQRETFRLRDDLAELRRTWRAADPRGLMRRDKELKRLGLDARALEDGVGKADLVSVLLDACRAAGVGDIAQLVPAFLDQQHVAVTHPGSNAGFIEAVYDVLRGVDDGATFRTDMHPVPSCEALLHCLQSICGELAQRRSRILHDDGTWDIATSMLRLPQGSTAKHVAERVDMLQDAECILHGLARQLHCSPQQLPQRSVALLRLCDERVAAQRIVESLQALLHVETIADVLPALKDVLDVGALRRRKMNAAS